MVILSDLLFRVMIANHAMGENWVKKKTTCMTEFIINTIARNVGFHAVSGFAVLVLGSHDMF